MHVLHARNVHEALPRAVAYMLQAGVERESRNGPVLQCVMPVTTVYDYPLERVIFHHERDANPFFHLYESLWMLAGRADLQPLLRYVKSFERFSDDGETLHGAYGCRWRQWFSFDQLPRIADALRKNANDRRCVLQMWDAVTDLGTSGKDVPCNVVATFQRHPVSGLLDMTVFNRSNDIVWGAYGANAVHFAFLQEYLAGWIGCEVGRYYQVSVNWHAYPESFEQVRQLGLDERGLFSFVSVAPNPYRDGDVVSLSMFEPGASIENVDRDIDWLLDEADHGFPGSHPRFNVSKFAVNAEIILRAHRLYSMHSAPLKFGIAKEVLSEGEPRMDWNRAAREWVERRETAWKEKNA